MLGSECAKFLIHTLVLWNLIASGLSYDYKNFEEWGKVCNAGKRQSPIDISVKNVVQKSEPGHYIDLINYNAKASNFRIAKEGRFEAKLTNFAWKDEKPAISGASLSNELYVFDSAHIHWSKNDNDGTEHSIGGEKYAAELHAVHVNVKYANQSEALKHPDGLAVIGTLYQVDNKMPINIGMQQFASFSHVSMSKNTTEVPALFDLSQFLPKLISSFYHYEGSLTTPPCTENVNWIVLSKPLAINSLTMKLLRNFGSNIIDNKPVRPLQQINDRQIEFFEHNY